MTDPPERRILATVAATLGRRAIMWLAIAILAALALACVELGISVFLQLFLKALGILNQEVQTTRFGRNLTPVQLALGLCILAFGRSSMLFMVGQSGNISQEMLTARLRRLAIWQALLHPSKAFVSAASINARTGDLSSKAALFAYAASTFLAYMVQTLGLALIMFVTARAETVIAMFGLGRVGLVVLRLNRITRSVAARIPGELRILTAGIERVARNTPLVRAMRTEHIEHRRLTGSIDAYAKHLIKAAYLANFAGALTPFAGILLIIVIVAFSQGIQHTAGITLLSFLYLLVRFVQVLSSAVLSFSSCNAYWPAFKDNLQFVAGFSHDEIELAMQATSSPAVGTGVVPAHDGQPPPGIDIRALTFAYPGSAVRVLDHLSLSIPGGSQFGIVGPSGCGKSTLLGLMLGLIRPESGSIDIGGRTPEAFFATPTMRVGYCGAEAFLFEGTIRENLGYGLSVAASDDDLWAALADAQLRATVEALPRGLEHHIAEDGSGLSAGQRQRLCLARALLRRPHLLVLDEVSANLDTDTEQAIAESLEQLRGRCTTILVAHRKAILKYADHVLDLEIPDGIARNADA